MTTPREAQGPRQARVFIVDDEPRMGAAVATALTRTGYACDCHTSAKAALDAREPDVVVTDWKMPEMDGLELLKELKSRRAGLPVIIMTAHADVPSAVAAMKQGAFDYVTKPFDNDELRTVVARALELTELHRENRQLRHELAGRYAIERIVAESPRSKEVLRLVERIARSKATVLIQGESGTGKEVIAKMLHFWSDRVGRPFVAVNCKAFAEGVLESELFGHEKGAFTGASSARAGCFERASGGTLFLDEIGEISPDFQAKLLRVLEESEVLRVGGSESRKVDVRVVAATNRALKNEVALGRFREDLYFRINVIPVQLAPLRERREDIIPLARHFLQSHAEESGRALALDAGAAELLRRHPWPGNVRELENAIERAVVLARGEAIMPEDLLLEELSVTAPAARSASSAEDDGTLQACLDRVAEARIRGALVTVQGQRAEAAKLLGVERTTLYRWMKRFGIP